MIPALSIGVPAGLWALAGLVPLLTLYFFRRRSSPRIVSALFLWRATAETSQSGPKLQRLQREWSLLLELLALLAATAFLADVRCDGAHASGSHAVVVVDGSFSMSARVDGERAADRVRSVVRDWLGETTTSVTLLESGDRPRMLAGPAATKSDALSALATWTPRGPSHDLQATFRLARELAGSGTQVLFVSDVLPTGAPKELELRAVGRPTSNTAFVHASREDRDGKTLLELRVGAFGESNEVTVPLSVTTPDGKPVHQESLRIPPGGVALARLTLPAASELQVNLPEDALPEDGRLTLVPDLRRPLRVSVAMAPGSSESSAVARVLAAFTDLRVESPPDLVFASPGVPVRDARVVRIGVATSQKSGEVASGGLRSYVGPFFVQKDHPLLDDVTFDGLVWTAGPNPPGRALVSAGLHSLVTEESDGTVHLNVDLSRSNVHRSNAWPLLFGNALDEARRGMPGFAQRNVQLGETLSLVVGEQVATPRWTGPEGERRLGRGLTSEVARAPGAYRFIAGDEAEVVDRAEVLPIDARESDLTMRATGRRAAEGAGRREGTVLADRSVVPLLVLLLALLLDYLLAAPGRRRAVTVAPAAVPGAA